MKDRKISMRKTQESMLMSSEPPTQEVESAPIDYAKMRVGLKTLDDAVIKIGSYQKLNANFGDKQFVSNALWKRNYKQLRQLSNFYYDVSGIYNGLCNLFAHLYHYDWYVTPFLISQKEESKLLKDFTNVLSYLDNSNIKVLFSDIALSVMKNGVYYGIVNDLNDRFTIQELPAEYCRTRFFSGGNPTVELNMKYFDTCFPNAQYRIKILKLFPQEVQKAYILYKQNKLTPEATFDDSYGWYLLDPSTTVRFTLGADDIMPPLVNIIPSLIDLDFAQDLDRKKLMQQLQKIIIQKLPLDKNGDLIFDMEEARDIHNNAVAMVRRAVGTDVLTTFADITVADMSSNQEKNNDALERVERTVFNNAQTAQNLFNTDGNLALDKSVAKDEARVRGLLLQFNMLLNRLMKRFNRANHYTFQVSMLETTIYNYKEISKLYKEQTQLGFSQVLPQIALGHSQSSIIANAIFEKKVLKLQELMIPPLSSNTMSASSQKQVSSSENKAGRPEKEDGQKSDKTIQNKESMS